MDAVLNATYLRKRLEPYFELPYKGPSMHEVVFGDDRQVSSAPETWTWQAAHRLRLQSLHRELSDDRARRDDDRADRDGEQSVN